MNPVRASLRYPQVTLVLTAMMFIAGVAAMLNMPRREDPKITIHIGIVAAVYPGATSREVEDQVTRKIEEHLFRFAEVRRDKTYSTTRNGMVIVNVELDKSVKDTDEFWSKLRLDMAQLKATELPAGVLGPTVDSDFGDTVAALIAVHGGDYGPRELKGYAQTVETALRTIPAVSKIKRIGDQKEEIEIDTSSERLSQYAVNPIRVMTALQGRNTVQFAGRVPAGQNKVPIDSRGLFQNEDQIQNLMVDVSPTGQPVYIGDLATVERVYKDPAEYARIDGDQTILLAVEMHEGNNIVDFGNSLHATLNSVQATLPPDVKLDLVADQPRVVSERIRDFFGEFGIAIVAVILVTMLLLPMRVALVSAIAIPVSVAMTFGVLNACGVELQQVSISALIVVLGMVVDNAIVIVDNYVELLDRKVPLNEAAERCATEMAVPVLTATLAIIAAFAPLMLLTGPVGEFIRSLPIAVAISLGTSFLVAMLLTPLMARFFIPRGLVDHEQADSGVDRKLTPLDHMQRHYNTAIVWAMQHKRTVLASCVLAIAAGIGILQLVPQLLFPLAERNQFVMDVWLPEGAKIEATDETVRRIESVLKQEQLVTAYTSFLGESAPRFYYNVNPQEPASNYAQILVNTKNAKETPRLVEQLRRRLPDVAPEAKVFVKELQQGQIMEAPVEVRISGDDIATLETIGNRVEDVFRHTPGATYIHTDWHEDAWQAGLNVREEVANRMGLTNAAIAQQLAAGFEGAPATTFWEGDRDVNVVLRLDPADRQSFKNVEDTYVMSPLTGAKVPLSAVATLTSTWEPGRIVRRNGVRTLTVRAFPGDHSLASEILGDARKQLDSMALPPGYRIEYGGEHQNQQETFGEMRNALITSLALIFLILLFQFRTLVDPLIVMTAFPLALPGAALGLLITHNTFGFTAFIGIISVGGLVVRNSIILIDYIHDRMKSGVALEQAALEAGERRLRPIFLTSAAAAVGVIPMILSGSSLWSPLASVLAFGLLGSMVFTLIAIPVLFVVVHGKVRNRKAPIAAVLVALCVCATPMHAQTTQLSLDEALQMAMKKNSTVRLAELKLKEADARLLEARSNYLPVATNQSNAVHNGQSESLTIPQGVLGVFGATGPIPANDVKIQLGKQDFVMSTTTVAQPLTQLFKIHAGVSVARAESRLAQDDLDRSRNEVALNVRKLYYGLLAAEQRRQAGELRIQAGEARLDEAGKAVESGVTLQVKVLEGRAQIADARNQLGTLEDNIADMRNALNDLIGFPIDTETELTEPVETSQEARAPGAAQSNAETAALAQNPELLSAQQTLNKAHAGLNAARAEFIPNVALFAAHVYQNGVPLLPDSSVAVGLRMDWTIVDFGKRIGQVRERRAQVDEAEENLHATENKVRMDVEKEARKVHRTVTAIEAAEESVAARAELLRITANQVEAKTSTESQLKDAQAQLAEAKARLFEAKMQEAIAQAELNRTLGQH
jgi:multidrug efflux pump subunit AcrB/outer membrane protein TolC